MKDKQGMVLIIVLILIIVVISYILLNNGGDGNGNPINGTNPINSSNETINCIAKNSKVYISTGCVACAAQERIFGKEFKYLNITDCKITPQECIEKNIINVPTWFINGKKYEGVHTIEQLKNLTGC